MAFLLDLPTATRRDLAARWGAEETTPLLYRAMTDPDRVHLQLARVGPSAATTLSMLARAPAAFADLLSALPVSSERLVGEMDALGALGLVLRLPSGSNAPRHARAPFGAELLYVPPDVARALVDA